MSEEKQQEATTEAKTATAVEPATAAKAKKKVMPLRPMHPLLANEVIVVHAVRLEGVAITSDEVVEVVSASKCVQNLIKKSSVFVELLV